MQEKYHFRKKVVQALLMLIAHFIFATLGKAQGKFNMMHLITIPITVPLKQINVFLLPIHWNFQVIKYHYSAYWKVSAQWKCEYSASSFPGALQDSHFVLSIPLNSHFHSTWGKCTSKQPPILFQSNWKNSRIHISIGLRLSNMPNNDTL